MLKWIGARKFVYVPMFRRDVDTVDNLAFKTALRKKIIYDESSNGDESFSSYIHTISSGRAWVQPVILEPIIVGPRDLFDLAAVTAATQHAAAHVSGTPGVDYSIALVGLDGTVPGAGGSAEVLGSKIRFNTIESIGTILMESVHCVTGLKDLYFDDAPGDLGIFDPMARSSQAHPTALTRLLLGWVDENDIQTYGDPNHRYSVRHAAIVHPSASSLAPLSIRVPGPSGTQYFVESRKRIDRFERILPSEGVIVYHLAISDQDPEPGGVHPRINLVTPVLLPVGGSFENEDIKVLVLGEHDGIVDVTIHARSNPNERLCQRLGTTQLSLEHDLDEAERADPPAPTRVAAARRRLELNLRRRIAAGCVPPL